MQTHSRSESEGGGRSSLYIQAGMRVWARFHGHHDSQLGLPEREVLEGDRLCAVTGEHPVLYITLHMQAHAHALYAGCVLSLLLHMHWHAAFCSYNAFSVPLELQLVSLFLLVPLPTECLLWAHCMNIFLAQDCCAVMQCCVSLLCDFALVYLLAPTLLPSAAPASRLGRKIAGLPAHVFQSALPGQPK